MQPSGEVTQRWMVVPQREGRPGPTTSRNRIRGTSGAWTGQPWLCYNSNAAMAKHYAIKLCGKRHPACNVCRPGYTVTRPENAKRTARHKRIRLDKKRRAVQLLGGKCQTCGYDKCVRALTFHHPDSDKQFQLSQHWWLSWERLKVELEKCALECANCHHERHCEA